MLEAGSIAPDFSLPDQDGTLRSLSEFKVKPAENPQQVLELL